MHENTNTPVTAAEPLSGQRPGRLHSWPHIPMYVCPYADVYKCVSQVSSFTKEPDSENEH